MSGLSPCDTMSLPTSDEVATQMTRIRELSALFALPLICAPALLSQDVPAPAQPIPLTVQPGAALHVALEKKVRGALAKAKGITVDNITVRARGGAVVLQGAVPEAGEIDHATEVAKSVEGVTSVKNALSIRPEGGI